MRCQLLAFGMTARLATRRCVIIKTTIRQYRGWASLGSLKVNTGHERIDVPGHVRIGLAGDWVALDREVLEMHASDVDCRRHAV